MRGLLVLSNIGMGDGMAIRSSNKQRLNGIEIINDKVNRLQWLKNGQICHNPNNNRRTKRKG